MHENELYNRVIINTFSKLRQVWSISKLTQDAQRHTSDIQTRLQDELKREQRVVEFMRHKGTNLLRGKQKKQQGKGTRKKESSISFDPSKVCVIEFLSPSHTRHSLVSYSNQALQ